MVIRPITEGKLARRGTHLMRRTRIPSPKVAATVARVITLPHVDAMKEEGRRDRDLRRRASRCSVYSFFGSPDTGKSFERSAGELFEAGT